MNRITNVNPCRCAGAALLLAAAAGAQVTVWTDSAAWSGAMAATQVADFDGYTGSVTNQHAGVLFTPLGAGAPTASAAPSQLTPQAVSASGYLLGQASGPGTAGGAFAMHFGLPIEGLGLWVGGLDPLPGTALRLYDPNGALLMQLPLATLLPAAPNQWQFFGVTVDPDYILDRVEVDVDPGDYVAFDDVTFGAVVDAGCTPRNGSGVNPPDLVCTSPPILGGTLVLDTQPNAATVATFVIASLTPLPTPLPVLGGELLIDPYGTPLPGSGSHTFAVPLTDPSVLGFPFSAQGLRVETSASGLTFVLLNAVDVVLGY